MKELSIIIPVYKMEKYIHKCLESVLCEAPINSEIILVDDGSPDNCPKICDEYANKDERVKVIHKENGGVSEARNCAIEIAQGEKIFFLDSDDYLPKNYFQDLMKYSADLVIGGYRAFYEDGQRENFSKIETVKYNEMRDYLLDFHKYFATEFNFPWGKIYKTSIIKENNIRFNPSIIVSEDVIFNIEYYRHCKEVQLVKEAQVQYRQLKNSASRRFFDNLFQWYLTSYKDIKDILTEFNAFSFENEKHYYSQFVGNAIECVLGAWATDKDKRRCVYKEICNNELLQESLKYYKGKRTKGIIKQLKNKNVFALEKSVKRFFFFSNMRKLIRKFI